MTWHGLSELHNADDWLSPMGEAIGDSATMGESVGEDLWREIDDWHMKVFQKPPSPGAQRWRAASLAINACQRMRLVLESNQPLNKGIAQQTAIGSNSLSTQQQDGQLDGINSHFTDPTLDEASTQAEPRNTCPGRSIVDDEARRCIAYLRRNFCIVREYYNPNGTLGIAIETKWPVAPDSVFQVVNDLHALFEGPRDPESLNPIPVTVPSSNSDEFDFLDGLPDVDVYQECRHGSRDEFFWSPSQSATEPMMFNMEEMHSQNNPLTPESARSVHPWDIPDLPVQMENQSSDWNLSDNTLMGEGHDGMESRQNNQMRLLDQPLGLLRNDQPWKDLIAELTGEINKKFVDIDQASDRSKLESVKSEVKEQAGKLVENLQTFVGYLPRLQDELVRTVGRISSGFPNIRQELHKAIVLTMKHFREKEWKHLFEEMGKISKKLEKIAGTLHKREVSAIKVFQNCASSINLSVEQILKRQSSNFISVTDFSHWYVKEVYNSPHFLGSKAASL